MHDVVSVVVVARDSLSLVGLKACLRERPEIRLTDLDQEEADVALVAVDDVDEEESRVVRSVSRASRKTVLVVAQLNKRGLIAGLEAGAHGFVRRAEATPESLVRAVCAVRMGEGIVPPDLLGDLLERIGELQRNGGSTHHLSLSALTDRQAEVLKLVADGLSTAEIARRLAYSERTIKGIIRDVTVRLNLRNRSHAVAFAVRAGLI